MMSLAEERNLSTEEFINRLGASGKLAEPGWYEIKAIYRKKGGSEWELHAAQIKPTDGRTEGFVEDYGEDAFVCQYLKFDGPSDVISLVTSEGITVSPAYPPVKAKKATWHECLIPSHASPFDVPVRRAVADVEAKDWGDNPLIGHNLPYYSSFNDRAVEFIEYLQKRERSIHLLVKDDRASLSIEGDEIHVHAPDDFDLVGQLQSHNTSEKVGGIPAPDMVDISEAKEVELWLIDKSGTIYDYVSSSTYPHSFQCPEKERPYQKVLEEIIKEGESYHIEYKKYIDLKKGDTKANEIVETVCAFSNADGGNLVIGVTDNAELVGIAEHVRKTYKESLSEALTVYKKDLNKLLYENLTDSDCFEIREVEVLGKWVIAISVLGNRRWNFLRASDTPYLRKGSSNTNATPVAVLECQINKFNGLNDNFNSY